MSPGWRLNVDQLTHRVFYDLAWAALNEPDFTTVYQGIFGLFSYGKRTQQITAGHIFLVPIRVSRDHKLPTMPLPSFSFNM